MSSSNFSRLVGHIWPRTAFMHVGASRASGGISTMWNLCSMTGFELWKDTHFLITEFKTSDQRWGLINIYASNNKIGRKETYGKMEKITNTMKDKQMMCMGDFNTPLYHSEKLGENRDFPESL